MEGRVSLLEPISSELLGLPGAPWAGLRGRCLLQSILTAHLRECVIRDAASCWRGPNPSCWCGVSGPSQLHPPRALGLPFSGQRASWHRRQREAEDELTLPLCRPREGPRAERDADLTERSRRWAFCRREANGAARPRAGGAGKAVSMGKVR